MKKTKIQKLSLAKTSIASLKEQRTIKGGAYTDTCQTNELSCRGCFTVVICPETINCPIPSVDVC
ncbi:hypothetical protein [Ascidiimonas aurantiaca]|uniref:hypothetical protein n=1 Tax=Ascidiimonas aurantiaca TaxID=1685432 RepID=UPI0030EDCFE4